jgi:hypothetical protein
MLGFEESGAAEVSAQHCQRFQVSGGESRVPVMRDVGFGGSLTLCFMHVIVPKPTPADIVRRQL